MTQETVNIAPQIFKRGKLLYVTFSIWTGTVTQSEEDLKVQGVENPDTAFYQAGTKRLVPKEFCQPFESLKAKFNRTVDTLCPTKSPFPATRLIPISMMDQVSEIIKETKEEFARLAKEAVEAYPAIKAQQVQIFNDKHPEHAGELDKYYPSEYKIGEKFGMSHLFFQISDLDGLESVIQEERENTRRAAIQWTEKMAKELRQSAVAACLRFREGMEGAKSKIDERSIRSFKNFLERFKNNNFMEDKELDTILDSIKTQVFNVTSWNVGEETTQIREHLSKVIELASREGAETEISNSFIEHSFEPLMEVELDSEHEQLPEMNMSSDPGDVTVEV